MDDLRPVLLMEPVALSTGLGPDPELVVSIRNEPSEARMWGVVNDLIAGGRITDSRTGSLLGSLGVVEVQGDAANIWRIKVRPGFNISQADWIGIHLNENTELLTSVNVPGLSGTLWQTLAIPSKNVVRRVVHCAGEKNYVDIIWSNVTPEPDLVVDFHVSDGAGTVLASGSTPIDSGSTRIDLTEPPVAPGSVRISLALAGDSVGGPLRFASSDPASSLSLATESESSSVDGDCVDWQGKVTPSLLAN